VHPGTANPLISGSFKLARDLHDIGQGWRRFHRLTESRAIETHASNLGWGAAKTV